MSNKTIAAIATSLGNSGISIIRVSGDDAEEIVDKISVFSSEKSISKLGDHTINYGHIMYKGEILDEVMISVMRAPNSYTGENVVEINTHGGMYVTKRVLSALIDSGAMLAEPGEFSKRAFLNGKMDLSKAEAVMDVICSDNELALKSGISQLSGRLAGVIRELREDLIGDIAYIEAALDDPEHIELNDFTEKLKDKMNYVKDRLSSLSDSASKGKIIRDGIGTVILGKPNAGKSSLMNVLLGTDRAIVTDIAGTTRDSLEESLILGDIKLRLIDTAGIRDTQDLVEKIGVKRSIELADTADLILYVVDSSQPLDDNDISIIKQTVGKKMLVIYNKTDLEQVFGTDELCKLLSDFGHASSDYSIVPVSTVNITGISDITDEIYRMYELGDIDTSNEIMLTNLRHKNAIDRAKESIDKVLDSLEKEMPEDFLTIDMMDAYSSLGEVIGESVDDDLVNNIFSRFCMGK